MTFNSSAAVPALIVSVGARRCAVPLEYVIETMRPLAIESVAGTPGFVRGVSVIRGEAVPVVDLACLLANDASDYAPGRFVTLRVGERRVAIAVDGVVGVRDLAPSVIRELPPLLRDVRADLIEAVASSDEVLLFVLRASHIVTDEVWAACASTVPLA